MNSGRGICCWTWVMFDGRQDRLKKLRQEERTSWKTAEVLLLNNGGLHKCAHCWGWLPTCIGHCCRAHWTVLTLHPKIFTCLVLRNVACRRGWRGTEERNASVAAQEGKQLYQAGMRAPFQGGRGCSRRWRLYSLQHCCSKGVWYFDTPTLLIVATSVRVPHVL